MNEPARRPPSRLLSGLIRPDAYSHPVRTVSIEETHISWVLLTGEWAYKLKKPVNLGFLDFSTLALRRHFCEEELRLNRRLAPDLYDAVVPITGTAERPRVGGEGAAIEYAVRMRQFPQEALAGTLLEAGAIGRAEFDRLADDIAAFHERAVTAFGDEPYGTPDAVAAPVRENFAQIRGNVAGLAGRDVVDAAGAIERWSAAELERLAPVFSRRRAEGRVRECHGDLHLGNVVRAAERLVPFDCIEFAPALRFIDVVSEVAFLAMDLEHHRRPDLAWRFVNRYLENGGDYGGLEVLRFYQVYRATVRGKICAIRAAQSAGDEDAAERALAGLRAHLELAERFTRPQRGAIVITHGLSGSGKTTAAQSLLEALGAVRVRSDVERKRLYGLPPLAVTRSAAGAGIYGAEGTAATYERLGELARVAAGAGFTAVVDATFLKRAERDDFRALAAGLAVPFLILDCTAPQAVLRDRIAERSRRADDASEADQSVLDLQLATHEPLAPGERRDAVTVEDADRPDWSEVLRRLEGTET